MAFFYFEYQGGLGFIKIKADCKIKANCKVGAIKIVRCLMVDPENWVMTQITESKDCHIPITAIHADLRRVS